ncbi:glycosyltransferase family protein [Algoriphagus sp.]|uniref:glycosyltransferase family protein n=1 Tax=Algoriphagus sp. TaxID=1872435 RepID=UPI0025FD3B0A|nr:glycosyltransferase family protein [Algoriphagus sp.]
MKFLFIVQGEGRGHLTQAIAFSKMLESQGHQLSAVIVGKSKRRIIPDFFCQQISTEIYPVESPNFETDKGEKRILIGKTISKNIKKSPIFFKSLQKINEIVRSKKPDIILNFYDLLGGLYNFLYRPNAHFWVIGHQYLIYHPSFEFARSVAFQKELFQFNTWLTALGAEKKIALAFKSLAQIHDDKLIVAPPLLREEVKHLESQGGDFILTYMVNPGYAEEVISFAKKYPHLRIKAYWDKKNARETENPLPNLSFHKIHDSRFLKDMAACKGLVCTAGFESVCEAMYLGKPVMVIPVKGQYEQACNALDTVASGAGIRSENFDFSKLEELIELRTTLEYSLKDWTGNWPKILQQVIPESKMTESDFILIQSFS